MCGYFPREVFWKMKFSHKPTWFFPQTDMIFPTKGHDFSHKPTWFFEDKNSHGDLNVWPSVPGHPHSILSTTTSYLKMFEIRHNNFKILFYSLLYYKNKVSWRKVTCFRQDSNSRPPTPGDPRFYYVYLPDFICMYRLFVFIFQFIFLCPENFPSICRKNPPGGLVVGKILPVV